MRWPWWLGWRGDGPRSNVTAYYNEHDPFAAAWLRELIKDDLIAPGEVDERSIEDVTPDDLRPFQQCHFFAGIGVWSLAARRAGIPDDAPLWSGSCPCQPFSAAGKGGGFDDERHLWPAFHYLIEQCEPPLVVGEQVAGADGDAWFDLVSADLDATGYAFGAAETCAAGFGAPHIRTRNYWVAVADQPRLEGFAHPGAARSRREGCVLERNGPAGGLADANGIGSDSGSAAIGHQAGAGSGNARDGQAYGLADHASGGRGEERPNAGWVAARDCSKGRGAGLSDGSVTRLERPGPTNGLWRNVDWLRCRDEHLPKWRPVESGTFPLADAGTFRNRVGLLRGAGNAITLGQAEGFLRAVIGSLGG